MNLNWCRKEIKILQGDVLEYYFDLKGSFIPPEVITHVYFSCAGENLLMDLTWSPEQKAYCLRLTSEETLQLTPMFCTYDISVEMIDGNKLTILHDCSFIVLRKRNSWVPEHYEEYDEVEEDEEENEDNSTPDEPEEPEEGNDTDTPEDGDRDSNGDTDDNTTSGGDNSETEENEDNGDENDYE